MSAVDVALSTQAGSLKKQYQSLLQGGNSGVASRLNAQPRQVDGLTAVDSNDLALCYTAINVALAGLKTVSAKHSDVLQDMTGTFDLVGANPPYMLDAGQRTYRHGGGVSGEGLSLSIVEESSPRLATGRFLQLYTGAAVLAGEYSFYDAVKRLLDPARWGWDHQELDPGVFGEQLLEPGYGKVERIAILSLSVTRRT